MSDKNPVLQLNEVLGNKLLVYGRLQQIEWAPALEAEGGMQQAALRGLRSAK